MQHCSPGRRGSEQFSNDEQTVPAYNWSIGELANAAMSFNQCSAETKALYFASNLEAGAKLAPSQPFHVEDRSGWHRVRLESSSAVEMRLRAEMEVQRQ